MLSKHRTIFCTLYHLFLWNITQTRMENEKWTYHSILAPAPIHAWACARNVPEHFRETTSVNVVLVFSSSSYWLPFAVSQWLPQHIVCVHLKDCVHTVAEFNRKHTECSGQAVNTMPGFYFSLLILSKTEKCDVRCQQHHQDCIFLSLQLSYFTIANKGVILHVTPFFLFITLLFFIPAHCRGSEETVGKTCVHNKENVTSSTVGNGAESAWERESVYTETHCAISFLSLQPLFM